MVAKTYDRRLTNSAGTLTVVQLVARGKLSASGNSTFIRSSGARL
jgi:hypothetical protein